LGVFGLILAISRFGASQAAVGALYLLRAASYLALFMSVYELVRIKKNYKVTLFKALLVVSLEVGFLGFVQYLLIPDLRFLYAFGWDDHLFRLVGTFLDPGFTGIILAFGSILALAAYLKEKKSIYLLSLVFLTLTLLLTYSRASFLAFGVGLATLFLKTKKGLILFMALLFALAIPFLPRPQGYGVRLERTHSIVSRLTNYSETFEIFKKSPVFGIGYNNMCLARQEFLGDKKVDSHACSGADSSVLLILATSGIVGLILVLRFVKDLLNALSVNYYSFAYLACLLALLVHSQFVNSLVYPWVMGYLAILGGISVFGSKGRS
jgi:O-antigen ligase